MHAAGVFPRAASLGVFPGWWDDFPLNFKPISQSEFAQRFLTARGDSKNTHRNGVTLTRMADSIYSRRGGKDHSPCLTRYVSFPDPRKNSSIVVGTQVAQLFGVQRLPEGEVCFSAMMNHLWIADESLFQRMSHWMFSLSAVGG